jgi:hypothetical protein
MRVKMQWQQSAVATQTDHAEKNGVREKNPPDIRGEWHLNLCHFL